MAQGHTALSCQASFRVCYAIQLQQIDSALGMRLGLALPWVFRV